MRKVFVFCMSLMMAIAAMAVPAKRGWQTRTQADGTQIEVQKMGDEFYHYTINRDGQEVRLNAKGMYEVVGEMPAVAKVQARRAEARRAKKDFGETPNLAPKGVVILVNYSDRKMKSSHTLATFDELCNSANCTVNSGYPSAREYFKSQSNGAYAPQFDVFGPVTLSQGYKHYGENDSQDQDERPTDAVIEACILANQQYADLNFANYDSDNDGYVDFVYVIYAGSGEADTDDADAIWPHNWSIQSWVQYTSNTSYRKADTKLDGVYLDNYAMSSELQGGTSLGGIGTLCHEFGHVIGLPDFYDTNYGTNYTKALTPNDWDVMDGGAYNGDGHCPPNYGPWEKYFMGWLTPVNLGNNGQALELKANGTDGYVTYQINTSGTLQGATTSGECYYIENRQLVGWDKELPSHGMLIWKMNYNKNKWASNEPNNTANNPLYTIVSATGTSIGTHINSSQTAYIYDGPKNPFPGSGKVTSKTIAGVELTNIAEANQLITLQYGSQAEPFEITWLVDGEEYTKTTSEGTIVLPTTNPTACEGWVFVGWCGISDYGSLTTAPTFIKAGDAAHEGDVYYAVFAQEGGQGGSTSVEDVLTRAETGVTTSQYAEWTATGASGAQYKGQSAGGNESIQLRSTNSNSGIVSTTSGGKLAKVTVAWNDATDASRTLDIYGSNSAYSAPTDLYGSNQGTKLGSLQKGQTELTVEGDYTHVGVRSKSGAMYLSSITFTWSGSGVSYINYTTLCGVVVEGIEDVEAGQPAVKELRNGQLVIIRGEAVYSVTGVRLQ